MNLLKEDSIIDTYSSESAVCLHAAATKIKTGWELFFNRDSEAVFDDIAAQPQEAVTFYGIVTQFAPVLNTLLDTINSDKLPTRAPTSLPSGWKFDGKLFSYTPLA
jgi:hypothetical protein